MRLHALHLANIERYEGERLSLAGDLHDEVLNELAALSLNVDRVTSPKFEDKFHRLTNRIREMISGLRPAMLNYGLHAALQELVDEITRRTRDGVSLNLELTSSQIRYASKVEGHLYRIVQQATENALRHSGGKTIRIYGELEPATACVNVEDDGIGFADHATLDFEHFLAQRHFGVARMFERAAIIGADLSIDAKPGQGTKVRVIWRP